MKDYTATITLRVSITARNDEQAEERAQEIADSISYDGAYHGRTAVTKKPWFGDVEIEAEAEEA